MFFRFLLSSGFLCSECACTVQIYHKHEEAKRFLPSSGFTDSDYRWSEEVLRILMFVKPDMRILDRGALQLQVLWQCTYSSAEADAGRVRPDAGEHGRKFSRLHQLLRALGQMERDQLVPLYTHTHTEREKKRKSGRSRPHSYPVTSYPVSTSHVDLRPHESDLTHLTLYVSGASYRWRMSATGHRHVKRFLYITQKPHKLHIWRLQGHRTRQSVSVWPEAVTRPRDHRKQLTHRLFCRCVQEQRWRGLRHVSRMRGWSRSGIRWHTSRRR